MSPAQWAATYWQKSSHEDDDTVLESFFAAAMAEARSVALNDADATICEVMHDFAESDGKCAGHETAAVAVTLEAVRNLKGKKP